MSMISQYTFTNAFNADKITNRYAQEMGISSYMIKAADTDGDGQLSFTEILTNTQICDKIMQYIESTKTTVVDNTPKDTQEFASKEQNVSYKA